MTTDSRSRIGFVTAAALVGLAAGVLVGFTLDKRADPIPSNPPSPSPSGPGPFAETDGVPTGYARTEAGAVSAAVNFSLITASADLEDPASLISAMETAAAPAWREEARAQASAGHEFMVRRYGGGAELSSTPVRYDVERFSPQEAVVKLWTVSVASGSRGPTVHEVWGTLTVQLAWVEGDWRVTGNRSSPGPVPVDLPSAISESSAISVMENFDEFTTAPAP